VDALLLTALGEPNRLRIVELLDAAPRSVGEIARLLELRQPQVTKHLQTLERAGLVTVHPLGQRRIYALRRQPLRELGAWLSTFDAGRPSESVLGQYENAIAAERASPAADRIVRVRRRLPTSAESVWPYLTRAELIRRWWSPEHFNVAECEADPIPGGILSIVMEEGDGTQHVATGHYVALTPARALSFELAPLDSGGRPLFSALHQVRLSEHADGTTLSLRIDVSEITPDAAPALAGIRIGWQQLLEKLAAELRGEKRRVRRRSRERRDSNPRPPA
jgi:uncharacterized protein YndB with AHSA1/START domain/DNA-binding transcriptional ArsR family regulator